MKKRLFSLILTTILLLSIFSLSYAAEVTLQWNGVAEADGYKVYYGEASRAYNPFIDAGALTTWTLVLGPGDYYFAVTAYNNYGESGYSEEVGPITIVMAVPGKGTASFDSINTTITWLAVENAVNYKVYQGTESGVYGEGTAVGDVLAVTLPLAPGPHYIAISAIAANWNESAKGEEYVIPVTGPPTNLTVTQE